MHPRNATNFLNVEVNIFLVKSHGVILNSIQFYFLNYIFLYFSAGKEESVATIAVKDSKDVFALLKGHERKVAAGEEPTFTWFKSGQEFDPQDRFKVLFKDEEDTLALVFQHINPEDAGLYTCVASTSAGKVSCSAELSVEGGVQQLLKVISFFQEDYCHSLFYVENATGFSPIACFPGQE